MPESFGDKQHDATPYRREKAREDGHVPRSNELASAIVLLGALGALLYLGTDVVSFLGTYTRRQLGEQTWQEIDRNTVISEWMFLVYRMAKHVLPMLGVVFLVGIVANVGQVGFLWLPGKLAFDLNRLNPLAGAQRLWSLTNVIRLVHGFFKILIVAAVAYFALAHRGNELMSAAELDIPQLSTFIVELALWTCIKIGAALLILAILDYGFQWWKHEVDLRMTTQEIREEMKYLQGDPQVIARRKAIQRQLVLQRMKTAVPKADVVVTNPTELAIAIQYDPETMDAPVVVAKGAGAVAQRIRQLALEYGVPIVERKELARYLYKKVEVGKVIPAEQYAAMAEVLRYVYQLKGKTLPNLQRAA